MKNDKENDIIKYFYIVILFIFYCALSELIGSIYNIEDLRIFSAEGYHRYQATPAAITTVLTILIIEKIKKRKNNKGVK